MNTSGTQKSFVKGCRAFFSKGVPCLSCTAKTTKIAKVAKTTKNTKVIKAAKTAKGCVVFFVFPSGSLFLG